MDFTILAVVLLIGVGVPIRNKLIRKYRDKKKQEDNAYGGGEWPLVRWPVATVRPEWPP